jgi:hypothetical protein
MEESKLDIYSLSRNFWNYAFDNPEKVNTNHIAIYFFAVEHCNRLGWKEKFGFPTSMAMEATGIKNWRTYSKAFNELVEFGLIKLIEKSTNQYSSNIIAIVKNTKAQSKALDVALQNHSQKQRQSKASIDIQDTTIQDTIIGASAPTNKSIEERYKEFYNEVATFKELYKAETLRAFFNYWIEQNKSKTKMKFELEKTWNTSLRLKRWESNNFNTPKLPQEPVKRIPQFEM